MTRQTKVCMVAYTIYPFDARVRREAETLAAAGGFDVTVICLKSATRARTYRLDGVTVRELSIAKYAGTSKGRYVAAYLRFLISAFVACSWLWIVHGVDVAHIHNMPNILVAAGILPKLFGRPLVLDMHDSMPDTFASKYRRGAGLAFRLLVLEERTSAWLSDYVICVNEIHKRAVVQRGTRQRKILIFMNVPDHRRFESQRSVSGPSADCSRFRLVYHGTVEQRLGVGLAVEAMPLIREHIPGAELHLWDLWGGGYRHVLVERAKQLAIEEVVHFHEAVTVDRLPAALANMHVGLVPYAKTTATDLALPVKMMEYIALGIPVVAPRLRAIQHHFSDEMVSFFEPDSAESMAEAVVRLYRSPSRRQAQTDKAREFLLRHGWQQQKHVFLAFYRDITGRAACRTPAEDTVDKAAGDVQT